MQSFILYLIIDSIIDRIDRRISSAMLPQTHGIIAGREFIRFEMIGRRYEGDAKHEKFENGYVKTEYDIDEYFDATFEGWKRFDFMLSTADGDWGGYYEDVLSVVWK